MTGKILPFFCQKNIVLLLYFDVVKLLRLFCLIRERFAGSCKELDVKILAPKQS